MSILLITALCSTLRFTLLENDFVMGACAALLHTHPSQTTDED